MMVLKPGWAVWALALAMLFLSTTTIRAHDQQKHFSSGYNDESDGRVITVETLKPEDDVLYITPDAHPDVFFADHFDSEDMFHKRWIRSQAKKDGADAAISKYDGEWLLEQQQKDPLSGDYGLVLKSKAKHAAISAKLKKPFVFGEKQLIVQYELNMQNGQDCGGGYIKLLSHSRDLDLRYFTDKTPYSIMFGPDKCGSDAKLHFIFRHINPKNKTVEEKHCKKLDTKERTNFEDILKDKRPHLYRLIVRPDNTFEMSIDYRLMNHGSLLEDFNPPVNPPAEIDDPNDKKPEDWDEREKIADPSASKPEDWDEDEPRTIVDTSATMPNGWMEDEPEMIPDTTAEKPEDWDDDMDGEWEAPLVDNPVCADAPGCGKWAHPTIDNPKYKGKWYPPLINNPNYKGKWKPAKIPNPEYYHDPEPFRMSAIGAIGIEIWSMSDDLFFDNLLITDDKAIADQWAQETFDLKVQKLDVNDAGLFRRILNYSNRNPWLYAVYVVVVGLPLVLIITFCCSGDTATGRKTAANGKSVERHPKKTDAVQDDDDQAAEEEGEEEEEEEMEEEEEFEEEEEPEGEADTEPLIEPRASTRRRRARKD